MSEKTDSTPLVSVLCMTYNHSNSIAQAIESIVSQKTSFPFELIIHDDASTDSTADIVREYEKKYPGIIRPIYQSENQFYLCNIAYKYLLPNAKGKYIAICEGDDFWTDENKLQMQFDLMESNPSYSMCFHAVNQLFSDGTQSPFRPLKADGTVPAEQIISRGGMFCPSVSLFFRRDVMECWPQFRLTADVYDYPTQVLAATLGEVFYTDKIMGTYRFASDASWTAQHAGTTDITHVENETKWLEEFDEYTSSEYSSAVDFHMAHLWFTEYRKNLSPEYKQKAKGYVARLNGKNKLIFTILFAAYTVLGKKANRIFEFFKKNITK